MKKFIKMVGMVAALVLWMSVPAKAWNWYAMSVPEMAAHGGATHMAEFTAEDFSASTVSNTAKAFTNAVAAKKAVEVIALLLDTAFTVQTTNYTDSCLLKIGDGSDDDYFLTSTELAGDGSEVWVKFGRPHSYTAVSTPTTVTTNIISSKTAGVTNAASMVTNTLVKTVSVATANTASELGRKLYPTAGSVVFTFTPDGSQALSAFKAGKVRVYFRVFEFGR